MLTVKKENIIRYLSKYIPQKWNVQKIWFAQKDCYYAPSKKFIIIEELISREGLRFHYTATFGKASCCGSLNGIVSSDFITLSCYGEKIGKNNKDDGDYPLFLYTKIIIL